MFNGVNLLPKDLFDGFDKYAYDNICGLCDTCIAPPGFEHMCADGCKWGALVKHNTSDALVQPCHKRCVLNGIIFLQDSNYQVSLNMYMTGSVTLVCALPNPVEFDNTTVTFIDAYNSFPRIMHFDRLRMFNITDYKKI